MICLPSRFARPLLSGFLGLVCLFVGGCFDAPRLSLAQSGHSCDNGNVGISSGGVVMGAGEPGALFGTIQRAAGKPEYSYLVILKMDDSSRSERTYTESGFAQCVPGKLQATSTTTFNGRGVQADHVAALTDDQVRVTSEVLKLQGREIDPDEGRLFLFDLSAASAELKQLDVELPSLFDSEAEPHDQVRGHVTALLEEHAEIKAFLED